MNKKSILCLYALFILSVSCNNNKTGTNTTNEPTNAGDLPAQIDTVSAGQTDTLIPKKSNAVTKGTEVKKEDPSLQNTAHQSPAVKRYLQELKKAGKIHLTPSSLPTRVMILAITSISSSKTQKEIPTISARLPIVMGNTSSMKLPDSMQTTKLTWAKNLKYIGSGNSLIFYAVRENMIK